MKRQAEALALKHKVSVAYVRKAELHEKEKLEWENKGNLNICIAVRRNTGIVQTLKAYYLVVRELKRREGDFDRRLVEVVHPAGIFAWLSKLFQGRDYYISEHLDLFLREDMGLDQSTPFGRWLRAKIHAKAQGTSISSQALKKSFSKRGIPRLHIIPNVVEIPKNEPQEWPPIEGPKKMIHLSSLRDHQKNIRGILHALKLLAEIRTDWEFDFLGSGPEIDQLRKESEDLGLKPHVRFLGYVSEEEKTKALQSAIAHVMLSHYEGFSVSTAEAVAFGCPVIVSDCGGPGDFVQKDNGYLIPKDPQILAETLNEHLDSFKNFNRKQMYEFIRARYSPEAVAAQYDQFLNL